MRKTLVVFLLLSSVSYGGEKWNKFKASVKEEWKQRMDAVAEQRAKDEAARKEWLDNNKPQPQYFFSNPKKQISDEQKKLIRENYLRARASIIARGNAIRIANYQYHMALYYNATTPKLIYYPAVYVGKRRK